MKDDQIREDSLGNIILDRKQEEYARRENKRCCDTGYWCMIKGTITWIYGTHYFELNFWDIQAAITKHGYKEYRERDRKFWMVWWQIKCEPKIAGLLNLKHRRAGATHSAYAESLICCMSQIRAVVDAYNFEEKTNKLRFNEMFKATALRCKKWIIGVNSLDEKSTKYEAKSPIKRKSVHNAQGESTAGTMSVINVLPTTERGSDGGGRLMILVDEFFKWELIDFGAFIDNQIPVVLEGAGTTKVGNIMCISSTEEIAEGNTSFEKWRESKKFYYDDRGRLVSPTDFIPLFFPAWYCLQSFCDKYGDSIHDDPDPETREWMLANPDKCPEGAIGAKQYLKEEKARLMRLNDNRKKYTAFCRKHPETEEEAFMGASGNNSFDRDKLITVLSIIRSQSGPTGIKGRIRRGNFEWNNPGVLQDGVRFNETSGGRTYSTVLYNDPALTNRMIRSWGGLPGPIHREKGCISVDPYSKNKVVDLKRASLGAAHGMIFFDESNEYTRFDNGVLGRQRMDYHPTPSIFLSYCNRPDDITVFYDDILKACVYYGLPAAVEANVGMVTMQPHFEEAGAGNYLLWRYEFLDNPGGSDYEVKGIQMSEKVAAIGYSLLDQFINGRMPHLNGYFYDLGTDLEAFRMPYEALIMDLLTFNFQHREPHDMTMSLLPGMIYYNKLFKGKGSIFESNRIQAEIESDAMETSTLLSVLGRGEVIGGLDRMAIQAVYNNGGDIRTYLAQLADQNSGVV